MTFKDIEEFDTEILKFWDDTVQPALAGRLPPDAQGVAVEMFYNWIKVHFDKDLWVKFQIICDRNNNPPADLAAGRLTVTVTAAIFGVTWRQHFKTPHKVLVLDS